MKVLNVILFVLTIILTASTMTGCATANRVPTLKEATATGDMESGIYNNTKMENVQVTVISLKARIEILEKELSDSRHETEYYKKMNDEIKYENLILRARGNYEIQKEVKTVKSFDEKANPVVETKTVNLEPPKKAEPVALMRE